MPLNRQLLRKVQALLSRASSRGLSKGNAAAAAAEEETASAEMLSARWASNASASSSATFASSSIPSSVRKRAWIVASLSWHDRSEHLYSLRRGRETSLVFRGAIANRRSFFTRALPLPAVAAGGVGDERSNSKKDRNSSDRRRSSSSSASTSSEQKRRTLPSEMPRFSQPSGRGQRAEWRTLLEDEVRRGGFFFFYVLL